MTNGSLLDLRMVPTHNPEVGSKLTGSLRRWRRRSHPDTAAINPQVSQRGMFTKHIATICDLVRFGAGLRIECTGCGAARTLDGFEAAKIGGGASHLSVLAARMRCARCGIKEAQLTILPPV